MKRKHEYPREKLLNDNVVCGVKLVRGRTSFNNNVATKEHIMLERVRLVPPTCKAIGVVGPMSVAEQGNVSKKGARRA